MQQVVSLRIHRIAAASDRGAQALVDLLQLPAAERKRQIGQRVHQLSARRRQFLLGAPGVARHGFQQVVPVRQRAADRHAPAAQHAADERQFLCCIAQHSGYGIVCVLLLRLERRHVARHRAHAQLYKVRQLIARDITHSIIQNPDWVKRRSAPDEILINLVKQPGPKEELEQRRRQGRQPFLLICPRHVLEQVA